MSGGTITIRELAELILAAPQRHRRKLIAIAGAPASGKSTLAERLCDELIQQGLAAKVVPMDGFHLGNNLLMELDLLARKGAPETFDVQGFMRLIEALSIEDTVYFPTFDRERDIAIAGSGVVCGDDWIIILEGNYLLFDEPEWRDLAQYWDYSVRLNVPSDILEKRLVERWLAHGLTDPKARGRAEENDLPNARRVAGARLPSDLTI